MTQDQIIQVLHKVIAENMNFTTWTVSTPHLVALVNHAIEAEREACAKLVEDSWMAFSRVPNYRLDITPFPELSYVAKAIRARGRA